MTESCNRAPSEREVGCFDYHYEDFSAVSGLESEGGVREDGHDSRENLA